MAAEDYLPFDYTDEDMWPRSREPRCKHCGKEIYWGQHKGSWVPYNFSTRPHDCLLRASNKDFPPV